MLKISVKAFFLMMFALQGQNIIGGKHKPAHHPCQYGMQERMGFAVAVQEQQERREHDGQTAMENPYEAFSTELGAHFMPAAVEPEPVAFSPRAQRILNAVERIHEKCPWPLRVGIDLSAFALIWCYRTWRGAPPA